MIANSYPYAVEVGDICQLQGTQWQPLHGNKRIVRKTDKQTTEKGVKQTAQKVCKRARKSKT